MKIHEYNEMMRYITRPPDKLSKAEKKEIVKDFYKPKSKPLGIVPYIQTMNRLYGSDGGAAAPHGTEPDYLDPKEFEDIKRTIPVSEMVKEERFNDKILKRDKYEEKKVAGIKDSALYKLLDNPKVLGVELGHETIMEVINLIQNSGVVKKPTKKSVKVAVVKKPEIDHIALLSNGDEFI